MFYARIWMMSALLVSSSGVVAAAGAPRACTIDDPLLSKTEQGVHASRISFENGNRRYTAEIRGLIQRNPLVVSSIKLCRRYEISNLGDDNIEEFRWPDVGLGHVAVIPPGHAPEFRWQRDVIRKSEATGVDNTRLFAWENIVTYGTMVFPLDASYLKSESFFEDGIFHKDLPTIFSDLFFDGLHVSYASQAIGTVSKFGKPVNFPELTASFFIADTEVNILSNARTYPSDKFVEVNLVVSGEWSGDYTGELYAPGLTAIMEDKISDSSDVRDYIFKYAKNLESQEPVPIKSGSAMTFDISYRTQDGVSDPLHISEQPIRINIGEQSVCVLAEVYSPLPVSLDLTYYCDR